MILITGHYANVEDSDDVLLSNFEKMFKLTGDIPLGMYECPAPYKRIIAADVFKNLLDTNRLVYHKDTSIELEQVKAKLEVAKDNSKLEFYDAHTPNAMYRCKWEQKACHLFQEIFTLKYWCGCATMQIIPKSRKK